MRNKSWFRPNLVGTSFLGNLNPWSCWRSLQGQKSPKRINELLGPFIHNALKTGITLLHLIIFRPSWRDTIRLLPCHYSQNSSASPWLVDALQPDTIISFLNTDQVSHLSKELSTDNTNRLEARLVRSIIDGLMQVYTNKKSCQDMG